MVMTRSMIVQTLKDNLLGASGAIHSVYTVDGAIASILHSIFSSVNPISFLAVDPLNQLAVDQLSSVRVSGSVLMTASICDGMFHIHTVCFNMTYDAENKLVQIHNIF